VARERAADARAAAAALKAQAAEEAAAAARRAAAAAERRAGAAERARDEAAAAAARAEGCADALRAAAAGQAAAAQRGQQVHTSAAAPLERSTALNLPEDAGALPARRSEESGRGRSGRRCSRWMGAAALPRPQPRPRAAARASGSSCRVRAGGIQLQGCMVSGLHPAPAAKGQLALQSHGVAGGAHRSPSHTSSDESSNVSARLPLSGSADAASHCAVCGGAAHARTPCAAAHSAECAPEQRTGGAAGAHRLPVTRLPGGGS